MSCKTCSILSHMNHQRVHTLNHKSEREGAAIAYWMSRDQRVDHNWALIFAAEKARKRNVPLYVFFALSSSYLGANLRHYDFMLRGLQEVEEHLHNLGFGFVVVIESPEKGIPKLVKEYDIGTLVCDFSPLHIGRAWRNSISISIPCAMYEVDAHNIVPCRIASQKQEYAAYTLRPKIHSLLKEFLDKFPEMKTYRQTLQTSPIRWNEVMSKLHIDVSVRPVKHIIPGPHAANQELKRFIAERLVHYEQERNNPAINMQSNLSPYLHFGHISAQYVALEVMKATEKDSIKDAFLEELIVRRELSDNYCYYNSNYDSIEGFPSWAKKTLQKHITDTRHYLYTKDQLEDASTHDVVWNYAQKQMVESGKMHGYLRMYWAKKLLEWTKTPQEALAIAIYLNDKYELDGRDPNGYVGIAWSIGGVHDRPWFERDIYGMIRYMSDTKIKKKLKL